MTDKLAGIDPRIIEQFNKRSPFALQQGRLLVLAKIGSHSHNTYIPKDDPNAVDDTDYMGIVVPPLRYLLGVKYTNWDGLQFQHEELDCVFYSFKKYASLMLKSNPNILGLTWLRPEFYVYQDKLWSHLLRHRDIFASKMAYPAFSGYAHGQMERMTAFDIDTQNEWDLANKIISIVGNTKNDVVNNRTINSPTLDQARAIDDATWLGEGASIVEKAGWQVFPGSPNVIMVGQTRIQEAIKSIKKIHARHFQGYMGDKRKNLVRKSGYDTKNAAHLIRLMRMCNEFLPTGELQVYRTTDAQEIRDIKSGKWSLDQVKAEAEKLFAEAKILKDQSPLPAEPDLDTIDILVQEVHLSAYGI